MRSSYCFSITAVFSRTRLNVTFMHTLSALFRYDIVKLNNFKIDLLTFLCTQKEKINKEVKKPEASRLNRKK
jgi:BarA-like signal transduction histidine kinase